MSEYANRVPLSVTLQRINKPTVDEAENRVEAPGPAGDENRYPKSSMENKKK